MYCCEKCFKDLQIKSIIKSYDKLGSCDICGAKNVNILDATNDIISSNIAKIIDLYSIKNIASLELDGTKYSSLISVLNNDWDIFNLNENQMHRILSLMFNDMPIENKVVDRSAFNSKIFLNSYSLFNDKDWNYFRKDIIFNNRFHSNAINKDVLKEILKFSVKEYKLGEKFYRARICKQNSVYTKEDMLAPPSDCARAGRANPEGISFLYLANSPKTTLYEIRAGINDYVSVATLYLKDKIEIVDLSGIDKISPFVDIDPNIILANRSSLKDICLSIAKPLRRYDSSLEYIPTQYICEFIKHNGYRGIQFRSSLYKDGVCYAIFDESVFEIDKVEYCEVKSIDYEFGII